MPTHTDFYSAYNGMFFHLIQVLYYLLNAHEAHKTELHKLGKEKRHKSYSVLRKFIISTEAG